MTPDTSPRANRSIEFLSLCSGRSGLLCLAEERTAGRWHREGPGSPDRGQTPAALHARKEESLHSKRAFRLPFVLSVCLSFGCFSVLLIDGVFVSVDLCSTLSA